MIAFFCWVAFITNVIASALMIRGEIIQSDFHKYVAIGISGLSTGLLFIACLFA